jgi:mutual gliding-motility protein MglA
MVMINHATREITMKIVYYGPGLCGKTTNLEYIYQTATPEKKGKLLTVATETDRTLFFDFLPMELGTVKGMRLRVQLYTVPGQVFYDATRRIVLRGTDGLVFVADSQKVMMDANVESLENLITNMKLNSLDSEKVPLVFQYNKRDLPGAEDQAEMDKILNWRNVPSYQAVAIKGTGVNETLKKIIELVIRRIHEQEAALKPSKPADVAVAEEPVKIETAKVEIPPPEPPAEPVREEPFQEEEIQKDNDELIEMEVVEDEPKSAYELQEVGQFEEEPLPIKEEELAGEPKSAPAADPLPGSNVSEFEMENIVSSIGSLQEKLLSILEEVDQLKTKIMEMKNKY